MPASNEYQIGIALQNAKGQDVTTPQYWLDVTGGDLGPNPEVERRSETGLGVDVGEQYIRVLSGGGGANVILRPSYAPLLFYGLLGAKAVSGATNFTHTITASSVKPFFTVWRRMGGQLFERFRDCHLTGGNVQWTPGGDVVMDMSILALLFNRSTTDWVGGTYSATEQPFRYPGSVMTVNSVIQNNIGEGNINFEWASTALQTNAITNSYLVPGAREITGSWNEVWETVNRYAEMYYGSSGGTAAATTQFEAPIDFEFDHAIAANSLKITAPRFKFGTGQPTPDPGGDPMRLPIAGSIERPASGSIATVAIVNQVASYPAAA